MGGPGDLSSRDPKNLSRHVKTKFEDVFGEAEGLHLPSACWSFITLCYESALRLVYIPLAVILGPIMAIVAGLIFGICGIYNIFFMGIFFRITKIVFHPIMVLFELFAQAVLAPCMQAVALSYSRVHVRYQKITDGEPPAYNDYFTV